jgi:hypothetical protein
MTTWTQKHNIKKWVEEKLYDAVEKLLPEGFELGFDASRISESSYLTITHPNGLDGFTIRISAHFKGYGASDEITVLMADGESMRTKTDIKKEVIAEVKKNIAIYA